MFKAIKEFFVGKPAPVVDAVAPGGAPYKVDAPWTLPDLAATIPVPLVVEPVASSEDRTAVSLETPVDIQNEQRHDTALTVVTAEVILTPISVATVTVESPVKVTRKPKSAPVAAIKEKAPAKAKAPKLTVVKAEKPAKSKKV